MFNSSDISAWSLDELMTLVAHASHEWCITRIEDALALPDRYCSAIRSDILRHPRV